VRDPTEKELWIFLGALIGIFVGTGLSIAMWHYTGRPSPRRCQTIPTATAAWGLSVQSTPAGLYFCYQQGAGQGMTEVVCTPMGECSQ
jgi:hypothetical protein